MPAKKTKNPAKAATSSSPVRELKAFYHGQPSDDFTVGRFYWPSGADLRQSIAEHFVRKRRPAGAERNFDTAAGVQVLLQHDVPEDYTDPDFIVRSYEEKLPLEETAAFAQVTMRFPGATNLHGPFERAKTWMRSHYVEQHGTPIVAILHAPYLAGSDAPVHVHGLILMRRLSPFAWLKMSREIASDAAVRLAQQSWRNFLRS